VITPADTDKYPLQWPGKMDVFNMDLFVLISTFIKCIISTY